MTGINGNDKVLFERPGDILVIHMRVFAETEGKRMREKYTITGIYEDDFGCEERSSDYEPMVIVMMKSREGEEFSVKQPDAWLYEQEIREGDEVFLEEGRLRKAERKSRRW